MITEQRIVHPNMHGTLLTLGDRQAEVTRTDSCCGTWAVFRYHGGQMWCIGFREADTDRNAAFRLARDYVRNGTMPNNPHGETPTPRLIDSAPVEREHLIPRWV